jgi:hypothetical protein
MIAPVPADWYIPQHHGGQRVSPQVRQLLYDLSLIGLSPQVHGLTLEVDTLGQLLRLLASPAGRAAANCWAVRGWIDRGGKMGENSDHAPDALIDIYYDMGFIGNDERAVENGTTPEQLLERLVRFRHDEGLA